jgi:hypothetical protein
LPIADFYLVENVCIECGAAQGEVVEGDVEKPAIVFGNLERLRRALGDGAAALECAAKAKRRRPFSFE